MTAELEKLAALIQELDELTRQARSLAADNPAVQRNLYMIQQHLEMLHIEICEPLAVLREEHNSDDG